jgi:Flp pilus assembly protein TadG
MTRTLTNQPEPCLRHLLRRRMAARARDEGGVSTLFVVLFATAMLAVAGLVIDGGYALGAKREAMNQAEQAARVGADALDQAALRSGTTRVDPGQAVAAAQAYLNQVGARGSVAINGGEVTVTVTGSQDTTILSAVGVTSLPIKATATALSIDEDSG